MAKIIIYSDKILKYRTKGTTVWTSIASGFEQEIQLEDGQLYEMVSSGLTRVSIRGKVEEIDIHSSKIDNIKDAFSGNIYLKKFSIESDDTISDGSGAFDGDINLESINGLRLDVDSNINGIFKDTFSLLVTDSANNVPRDNNLAFQNTSLPVKLLEIENLSSVAASTNIIPSDVIDLSRLKNSNQTEIMGGNLLSNYNISYVGSKLVRGTYNKTTDDSDDNFRFEMDLKPNISDNFVPTTIELQDAGVVESQIDDNFRFEMDLKPNISDKFIPTTIGLDNDQLIESQIDDNFRFEMDLKPNISDKFIPTTIELDEKNLFDSNVDDNFRFEMDIIPTYTLV